MKLYAECIACQVSVRLKDVERLVGSEDHRVEAMKGVIEMINRMLQSCKSRYDSTCTPTNIATNLFRYIKNLTGAKDPYRELKRAANRKALEIYERLRNVVVEALDAKERLLNALRISLVGNLLDIGVAGYKAPEVLSVVDMVKRLEVYGDVDRCLDLLLSAKRVAVIMDNAGEAVLDRILADVLRSEGKYVVAVVKKGAFQNDITLEDVDDAELAKSFDEIVDSGTDASSIFLDEVDKRLLDLLNSVDVVVSKGMANYEYIVEVENVLGRPVIYMLVAKCMPIARDLGVPLGKAVVKVSKPIAR